jgi:3'(2'), 5'-bisphosphate nucleotidase
MRTQDRRTVDAADHADAAAIAAEAGRLLVSLRSSGLAGDELRREGDRRSHELIAAELGRRHPDDAVLSEEGRDDRTRLERHRSWIVDPLDGTREFGEPGRTDWAVHVALVLDGRAVCGAVALPATGVTFSTAEPAPLCPARGRRLRLVVSRTRPGPFAEGLAAALVAELVPMGSAGAKAMAVVAGDADLYAHSGGQYEWDSAAPVAVALACGLHASRLDGSPLRYNRPDPFVPDLLVCRPELSDRVLGVLADLDRTAS